MSALQALLKFVQVLQGPPMPGIAAGRIGLRRPAGAGDLPMIAAWVAGVRESPVGVGRFVSLTKLAEDEFAQTTGSRCTGELHAELWAGSADAVTDLLESVRIRLNEQAAVLVSGGFSDLSLKQLGPAQPASAGADPAFLLPLTFEMSFEDLVTPPPGGEGIIRTVHADLTGEFEESLEIR